MQAAPKHPPILKRKRDWRGRVSHDTDIIATDAAGIIRALSTACDFNNEPDATDLADMLQEIIDYSKMFEAFIDLKANELSSYLPAGDFEPVSVRGVLTDALDLPSIGSEYGTNENDEHRLSASQLGLRCAR